MYVKWSLVYRPTPISVSTCQTAGHAFQDDSSDAERHALIEVTPEQTKRSNKVVLKYRKKQVGVANFSCAAPRRGQASAYLILVLT